MSNKTQLQTNNTKLDALITRVNSAKDVAASLPEASSSENLESVIAEQETLITELSTVLDNKASGGGGGSNLTNSSVTLTGSLGGLTTIYNYIDETGSVQFVVDDGYWNDDTFNIKVLKNSVITFASGSWQHDFSSTDVSGAIQDRMGLQGGYVCYLINSDQASFNFSMW